MKNIRARKLSILAFVVLTFGMWVAYFPLSTIMNQFLNSIHKPMSSWSIALPIFGLSFGLIPLICHATWKKRKSKNLRTLVAYNATSALIGLLMCLFTFLLIDLISFSPVDNPLVPEYVSESYVWLPFPGFWNIGLPFCTLCFPIVLYFISTQKTNDDNTILDMSAKSKNHKLYT